MFIRGVDSSNFGNIQNILDSGSILAKGSWDASMDAKNVLIDDSRQWQSIKDLVASLPDTISNVVSKSTPTLVNKGSFPIMFFPSIDIACFVIATQQEDFVGQSEFHGQEVGRDFQTGHAPIDVISEEQEATGCQGHAQPPDIVREKMQIFQVAVNVSKDVCRGLQIDDSGFSFQYMADFLTQLEEIFGELFTIQIIQMFRRPLEHVQNPEGQGMVGIVIVRAGQGRHDLLRVNTGLSAHSFASSRSHNGSRVSPSGRDGLDVGSVWVYLAAFGRNPTGLFGGFELIGERRYLRLQHGDLLIFSGYFVHDVDRVGE